MRQKTAESTASYPLGYPGGKKLFRVEQGQYAGRQIILFAAAPGQIACAYADRPYASWTAPVAVITDTADSPFDAVMAANGDLHVVYTDAASSQLVTRRLAFSGGAWSAGGKVVVSDQAAASGPSVIRAADGSLWVCWDRTDLGLHTLYAKSSVDNGATWGTGPTDPGDALTSGSSSVFGKLAAGETAVWAIYSNGSLQLSARSRPLSSGSWGSEYTISSGSGFDEHFDVAVAADGRLAVAWDNAALRYREFDGDEWLPSVELDANGGFCPQLVFIDRTPLVIYLSALGADQAVQQYTVRQGGVFSTPAPLDRRATTFDGVVLYDSVSSAYAVLTAEAADAAAGDVAHPVSGLLLHHSGDALYLGMDERFRYVKIILSTAGAGGSVACSYWDGSAWAAFTPAGGIFNFDALDRDLLFWEDYNSLPADWQKRPVGGAFRFWVKIEAVSDFTTPPVGSRLTAVSDLATIIVRR